VRYRWPKGRQSAAVLSFDFDAESGFLFREPEKAKRSLADLEERRFGPRVGVDRILRLLDRLRLRASFFIPGWTVLNHLPECRRIRDAGHEIGAHGNVHEAVGTLDAAGEEAILLRPARDPQGRARRQAHGLSLALLGGERVDARLLKAHGFGYDTSLMGNDVPYDLGDRCGAAHEVPVQWLLDDAPLFRHVYGASKRHRRPRPRAPDVEPRVRGDARGERLLSS